MPNGVSRACNVINVVALAMLIIFAANDAPILLLSITYYFSRHRCVSASVFVSRKPPSKLLPTQFNIPQ